MKTTTIAHTQQPISPYKWLIVITVMLVSTIEILDITIVNVSLPAMMSGLGASSEQITWVLTAYVVSAGIFTPLTGFLEGLLGQKNLLLLNIVGFLLTSAACGAATDLTTMVLSRILQGIFGASLIPLSQSILRNTFPPNEQGKAMALWGVGIMAAPILGPTLGGFITENMSWRWIFYLNVPICIIGALLTIIVIKDNTRKKTQIDWLGLIFLGLGIGCLQFFLDQGNQKGWLESPLLFNLMLISLANLVAFIIHSFNRPNSIINFQLFKDTNFSVATLLLALICSNLFSTLFLQPIMLQTLFHYSAIQIGVVMAPRSVLSAIAMGFSVSLAKRFSGRSLIIAGTLWFIIGDYLMTQYNLQSDFFDMILPGLFQGLGMGLIFPPLSKVALNTIPKSITTEAAGVYNYGRTLGTAIGLSLFSTLLSHEAQVNWQRLGGYIQPMNPLYQNWLQQAHQVMIGQPNSVIIHQMATTVYQQAHMMAFIDSFWLQTVLNCLMVPIPLLLKTNKNDFNASS